MAFGTYPWITWPDGRRISLDQIASVQADGVNLVLYLASGQMTSYAAPSQAVVDAWMDNFDTLVSPQNLADAPTIVSSDTAVESVAAPTTPILLTGTNFTPGYSLILTGPGGDAGMSSTFISSTKISVDWENDVPIDATAYSWVYTAADGQTATLATSLTVTA